MVLIRGHSIYFYEEIKQLILGSVIFILYFCIMCCASGHYIQIYCISMVMIVVFTFQSISKNQDPSNKMDLDFQYCFDWKKPTL